MVSRNKQFGLSTAVIVSKSDSPALSDRYTFTVVVLYRTYDSYDFVFCLVLVLLDIVRETYSGGPGYRSRRAHRYYCYSDVDRTMKDLCSGCACWVEDGWSYCMQCGKERAPLRRPPLTLPCASSPEDVYGRSTTRVPPPKQVSTPPKERGKRKLLRRRQSSDEVLHQLRQV